MLHRPNTWRRAGLASALLALVAPGLDAMAVQEGAASIAPRGPYFGAQAPGMEPCVFAPGIVSLVDRYEYVIAFSPDGDECCFGVTDSAWSACRLLYARQEGGVWTEPEEAYFQGEHDAWLPFFAPDGERFYFSSGRAEERDAESCVCDREGEGWGPPRELEPPLNSPAYDWRPHTTAAGTLYFCSSRAGGEGDSDLYRAVQGEDGALSVENLGPPVNTSSLEASPFVSPDERYLLLESWRPGGFGKGDLYVAYRRDDGSWTEPRNLGPTFNTEAIEDGGYVSPDGKYFFFNRRRDWVTDEPTDLHWVDLRAVHAPYVLHPVGEVHGVVGEELRVELPADQFADYDDERCELSVVGEGGEGLPGWLSFEPSSRTLRGTPPVAGTYVLEVRATDPNGGRGSDRLTVRVES